MKNLIFTMRDFKYHLSFLWKHSVGVAALIRDIKYKDTNMKNI